MLVVSRVLLLLSLLASPLQPPADGQTLPAELPVLEECLVLPPTARGGRTPIIIDPLESLRVSGTPPTPSDGNELKLPDGRLVRWRALKRSANNAFEARELNGGWALFRFEQARPRVVVLRASGHFVVYVNGVPRAGDPYATGSVRLPVQLVQGTNTLLFNVGRGQLSVVMEHFDSPIAVNPDDLTLPDPPIGATDFPLLLGVPVLNLTDQPMVVTPTLTLDGSSRLGDPLTIAPMTARKLPLRAIVRQVTDQPITLRLSLQAGQHRAIHDITLTPVAPDQPRRVTFESAIDGSVQYYALLPSWRPQRADNAIVLSLHGAAVEAISQARAYAPKTWAHIVCPTNRRPFGFDWEDWGRLDAIEVLEHASRQLRHDPSRVHLTGHSMGGHGAWQLGVHYPGRFATVAPSAAWISFQSYATARNTAPTTAPSSAVQSLLDRAAITSDTLALKDNLHAAGVFILHGVEDDNVPVSEARKMAGELMGFHRDWRIHEQPAAGHWWESSDEPGAECLDFPAIFDFFAARRLPATDELRRVRFKCVRPHELAYVAVLEIDPPGSIAQLDLRFDPLKRRIVGTTRNVRRLRIAPPTDAGIDAIELDGQSIALAASRARSPRHLLFSEGVWREADEPSPGSLRTITGFRDVFANRMVFVVGTRGSAEENAFAYALARFHAETWLVRGNGGVELLTDREFVPSRYLHRNVILYGNADINSAWSALLERSPLQLRRDHASVGERVLPGDDLAALFVRPSPLPGSSSLVGVVGFTGTTGARLAQRLAIFVSGVHYPDFFIADSRLLASGHSGVRATGFFGPGWSLRADDHVLVEH